MLSIAAVNACQFFDHVYFNPKELCIDKFQHGPAADDRTQGFMDDTDDACARQAGEPSLVLYNGHAGLGANLVGAPDNPSALADRVVARPFDCGKNEVAIETLEVAGIVTDNKDPDSLAQAPTRYSLPEVDDQVLVAFEHGAARDALVLGSLWHAGDKPPQSSR